nr:MAG TPA: hypothetical protein [Caudoviricetes sp.]
MRMTLAPSLLIAAPSILSCAMEGPWRSSLILLRTSAPSRLRMGCLTMWFSIRRT